MRTSRKLTMEAERDLKTKKRKKLFHFENNTILKNCQQIVLRYSKVYLKIITIYIFLNLIKNQYLVKVF